MGSTREEDFPSELEQELGINLQILENECQIMYSNGFYFMEMSLENNEEQVFKSMNMAQIDRSYLHEVHSLVRKMAKKLASYIPEEKL